MAQMKSPAGSVRARILRDCSLGKVNDVVTLEPSAVKAALWDNQIDIDPAAVAYAEQWTRDRAAAREAAEALATRHR